MAEAEVLAYPCDTTTWSEGFSCTVLEACAARACPNIIGCDALGTIYKDALQVTPPGMIELWRQELIEDLLHAEYRDETNDRAEAFAKEHTWKNTATKLMAEITARLS